MALGLVLLLVLLFSLWSLADWRRGIVLLMALAAVQDPLRKLVPGTPGWLVLATAPVFFAAVLGSMASRRSWWADFAKGQRAVAHSILLLCMLALPAALVSATYGEGSWKLTVLGIFSYSVIFFAIVAGFHFSRGERDIRRLLVAYCLIHGVMLSGAVLEFFDIFAGSRLIGSRALGYEWIRWGQGYTVDMIAGFYRSADVMGWHAAAVAMISVILAFTTKGKRRWMWLALSLFATIALLLCGRRKMVYMLPVFLFCLGYLFWQAGRAARVVALMGFLAIPVAGVSVVGDLIGEGSANIRYYSGEGLQRDAWESIRGQGFTSMVETFRQNGVFGAGLGFATPGSHHLAVSRPRVWQESMSSRIMVELGVPGVFGFLLVMSTVAAKLWHVAISHLRARSSLSIYAGGLVAFFMANVGSLVVSGQVLADPFIASFLGFLVGVGLSMPRVRRLVVTREARPIANSPTIAVPVPVAHEGAVPAWRQVSVLERQRMEELRTLPW